MVLKVFGKRTCFSVPLLHLSFITLCLTLACGFLHASNWYHLAFFLTDGSNFYVNALWMETPFMPYSHLSLNGKESFEKFDCFDGFFHSCGTHISFLTLPFLFFDLFSFSSFLYHLIFVHLSSQIC